MMRRRRTVARAGGLLGIGILLVMSGLFWPTASFTIWLVTYIPEVTAILLLATILIPLSEKQSIKQQKEKEEDIHK